MKMFGNPKNIFLKFKLDFEVYGQRDKITPGAEKKRPLFDF